MTNEFMQGMGQHLTVMLYRKFLAREDLYAESNVCETPDSFEDRRRECFLFIVYSTWLWVMMHGSVGIRFPLSCAKLVDYVTLASLWCRILGERSGSLSWHVLLGLILISWVGLWFCFTSIHSCLIHFHTVAWKVFLRSALIIQVLPCSLRKKP